MMQYKKHGWKQFALIFDDVACIYHQEIWHVYNVNC